MTAVAILLGLALLYAGGELLVRGSVAVAAAFGLSPLLIGITLVGFGTSTPELATSIDAALRGSPGIAIGNVVGSNIANVLLILGLAMVIAPIVCTPRAFARDVSAVAASGLVILALAATGAVGRLAGLLLLAALGAYLALAYLQERSDGTTAPAYHQESVTLIAARGGIWLKLSMALAGIVLVVAGAPFLVDGAVELSVLLGVPDTVIGLTVVAVGTSLPELAATVAAALKRHGDIVLGNVLGSCLFNAFGILGATAVVRPLAVPSEIVRFDAWVLVATGLLLAVFTLTRRLLTRGEGFVLLAGYAAYVAWLAIGASA